MRKTSMPKQFLKNSATLLAALLIYESAAVPIAHASAMTPAAVTKMPTSDFMAERKTLLAASKVTPSFRIPATVGTLVETYAPKSAGRLVYHFQDVHEHVAAQTNLAEMVSLLERYAGEQGKNVVIAVEGGFGAIDSDRIARLPNQKNKEDMGAAFLRAGYILGEEYAAITTAPGRIKLVGIEDATLYRQNVDARSVSRVSRAAAVEFFGTLRGHLEKLKRHNFSPLLTTLEDRRLAVEAGTASVTDYAVFLANSNPKLVATYPNVSRLAKLTAIENSIDFGAVEKETQLLVAELTATQSDERIQKMMEDGEAMKGGRLSALAYYQSLLVLASGKYPALTSYVSYLRASEEINPDALFDEVMQAEERVAHTLIRHPIAEQLYDHLRWVERQEKFFSLNLIPQEWAKEKNTSLAQVEQRLATIRSFVAEQQEGLGYRFVQPVLSTQQLSRALVGARSFYQAASDRNALMVQNLARVLKENPEQKSIVAFVAGGFHTPEMTHLLRLRGVAYEVFRPQLESDVVLSENVSIQSRRVNYLRQEPGLAQPGVASAVEASVQSGRPKDVDANVQRASAVAEYQAPAVALPKMLQEAAALIGTDLAGLQQPDVLAKAVDAYNVQIGGLENIIAGRTFDQTKYKATEIKTEVTPADVAEFVSSVEKGERVWLVTAAGRATRQKLSKEFDQLGIAGLTPALLKALKAGNPTPVDLINRAAAGTVESFDDLSFVQRQALRLVQQARDHATTQGSDVDRVLKGLQLVVIVNEANHAAVRRQLAAIKFPGRVRLLEQPEVGGVSFDAQGNLVADNTNVFPEGHGEPFIATAQRSGASFELLPSGQEVKVDGTLQAALVGDGAKYLLFGQVNDLLLLGDMASLPRFNAAIPAINNGAEMVLEMVENGQQKGGGAFKRPDSDKIVLRDTLAMEDPSLAAFTIPTMISRMTYVLDPRALTNLNWDSIPRYLKVRAGAGADGRTLITSEFYSGDASSVLATEAMVQPGLKINTFKEQAKIDVALEALEAQNAQIQLPTNVKTQNISARGALRAVFTSILLGILGVVAVQYGVSEANQTLLRTVVAVVFGLSAFTFAGLSAYLASQGYPVLTAAAPRTLSEYVSANGLTEEILPIVAFAKKVGLDQSQVRFVDGSLADVAYENGQPTLEIGVGLLGKPALQKVVLSHEYVHFTRFQLTPTNVFSRALNEFVAFPGGLLLSILPAAWNANAVSNEATDFAAPTVDSVVRQVGDNQQLFETGFSNIIANNPAPSVEEPRFLAINADSLDFSEGEADSLVQLLVTLNEKIDAQGKPVASVAFYSASGNSLALAAVRGLITKQSMRMKGLAFGFAENVDGTNIQDVFKSAGLRAENLQSENAYVLSTVDVVVTGAQFVRVTGTPHLALATVAYARYKNSGEVLSDLVSLFEKYFPELDMAGHLSNDIAAQLIAAIQA